ncbi:hypothetical protein L7F22_041234 [Adiantum nelumboides]|nr:hypothetical protein [Adiantum nelumboides]
MLIYGDGFGGVVKLERKSLPEKDGEATVSRRRGAGIAGRGPISGARAVLIYGDGFGGDVKLERKSLPEKDGEAAVNRRALTDDDVKTASLGAFLALPDLKVAIRALSALKDVGPATASAVLAKAAPDVGSVKHYTLKQYGKAHELTKSSGKEFTPSNFECALWHAAMEKRFSKEGIAR